MMPLCCCISLQVTLEIQTMWTLYVWRTAHVYRSDDESSLVWYFKYILYSFISFLPMGKLDKRFYSTWIFPYFHRPWLPSVLPFRTATNSKTNQLENISLNRSLIFSVACTNQQQKSIRDETLCTCTDCPTGERKLSGFVSNYPALY